MNFAMSFFLSAPGPGKRLKNKIFDPEKRGARGWWSYVRPKINEKENGSTKLADPCESIKFYRGDSKIYR